MDLSTEEDVGVLRARVQALETTLGHRGRQLDKLRDAKRASDTEAVRLEAEVKNLEMARADVKRRLQAALDEGRELNRRNSLLQKQYAHTVRQFFFF